MLQSGKRDQEARQDQSKLCKGQKGKEQRREEEKDGRPFDQGAEAGAAAAGEAKTSAVPPDQGADAREETVGEAEHGEATKAAAQSHVERHVVSAGRTSL